MHLDPLIGLCLVLLYQDEYKVVFFNYSVLWMDFDHVITLFCFLGDYWILGYSYLYSEDLREYQD